MPDLTEYEAAYAVGEKVLEMCDRVKPMNAIVPGTRATWEFEVEDVRYRVVVSVVNEESK